MKISALVAIVKLDEEKLAADVAAKVAADLSEETPGLATQAWQASVQMGVQMGEAVSAAASDASRALAYRREEILNEIKFFVNQNVNRISRIDQVEAIEEFDKTASQKIKRYLYNIKKSMHIGGTEK